MRLNPGKGRAPPRRPPLTVDVGRPVRSAARASGFVLQSDDAETFAPASYLDSR